MTARLTLTRYGHVIDELEDTPRIEAEAAISKARLAVRIGEPRIRSLTRADYTS
jgi:hypothetical protein